jgi:hypothetical protein
VVDIVYVVGAGNGVADTRPLRWSLRSLDQFATGVGRVIVVGSPPYWLSDNVVKIKASSSKIKRGKHWNILDAIRSAIVHADIDRPFLYSSDDHYFLKPADLHKWPHFSCGRLPSSGPAPESENLWVHSLWETGCMLAANGLSTRMAHVHMNTWMDPDDLEGVLALANANLGRSRLGFEPSCLFNAMYERRNPDAEFVFCPEDSKVQSVADIKEKIERGIPMFSTTPEAEEDAKVVEAMYGMYPRMSIWEAREERR